MLYQILLIAYHFGLLVCRLNLPILQSLFCSKFQNRPVRNAEKHQEMDGVEKLAVVETLHQGQASSQRCTCRGRDEKDGRRL